MEGSSGGYPRSMVSLPVLIAGFNARDTLMRGLSLGAIK